MATRANVMMDLALSPVLIREGRLKRGLYGMVTYAATATRVVTGKPNAPTLAAFEHEVHVM